ncbi:DNA-binding protein inhibitor ID-2b [Xyrichtys novacula]|uniref:DNA-binding protein inhibitor ID-2b n=1 Tax=Xyrichtys novacula TaxID=13765 RepID=A0AAV1GVJ3_XYRNO|nr:DNA-binding protein inhibitor ID-2b [Xyrichtys novacula]
MKAGSPVLSADRRSRGSREQRSSLRGFSWNKSLGLSVEEGEEVPVLLLQNMNLCYRLLRRLVPGLPPGRAASRVEILQRVIDYILELQTELDATCPDTERPETRGTHTYSHTLTHTPARHLN